MTSLYSNPVIIPQVGKSDHHGVLCSPSPVYDMLGREPHLVFKRLSGHNEKAMFAAALQSVNWSPMYSMSTCEEQFKFFESTMNNLLDTYLPITKQVVYPSDKPWITDRYRNLIKQRQRAYFRHDMIAYCQLRNKVNRMSKYLKSSYYSSRVQNLSKDDSRNWWSCINSLLGRKQSSSCMESLAIQYADGDIVNLANKINDTFQRVSADLPKLVPTHQHPNSVLSSKYIVSVSDVERKLFNIKVNKSMGPDQIPNWVYHDFAGVLSKPIAAIFNSSFSEGYIPSIWKSANVVPLPKVQPPQKLEKDLRPISLTPSISKIQESFMYAWIWEFFRHVLDRSQYGAIKGTCTTHALITMLHHWLSGTDDASDRNFIQIVLLDYAKAFDHVDPNILMQKLTCMNIPDALLRWIENFLSHRQQRVKIGCALSDWTEIWGTVPQGTLLGVLCFIVMINDLSTNCSTVKYVDDTTIFHVTSDTQDCSLQNAVNVAIDWSDRNNMKINPSKTKEMLVHYMKNPPDVPNINVQGQRVERVKECKLLGVYLNDKLNWNTHVDKIYRKASQRVHFINCLKRTKMSNNELVKVYVALVRPLLEYACELWHSGLTMYQRDLIESVQERVLKIIFPILDYEHGLEEAKLDTLEKRRDRLCEKLFLQAQFTHHKLNELLPPLKDYVSTRDNYPFVIPFTHTNRFRDSFINYALSNKW